MLPEVDKLSNFQKNLGTDPNIAIQVDSTVDSYCVALSQSFASTTNECFAELSEKKAIAHTEGC